MSDRVIEVGDVVVVDIGGPLPSGYNSDSTRTYAVGARAVRRGPRGLRGAAARPGAGGGERAARRDRPRRSTPRPRGAITEAGLGERFIHRTGHGIGLDVHEEPYIVGGNTLPLEPGMAFSVEPGVYLDGELGRADRGHRRGHRRTACERLNNRPRDLVVLVRLHETRLDAQGWGPWPRGPGTQAPVASPERTNAARQPPIAACAAAVGWNDSWARWKPTASSPP